MLTIKQCSYKRKCPHPHVSERSYGGTTSKIQLDAVLEHLALFHVPRRQGHGAQVRDPVYDDSPWLHRNNAIFCIVRHVAEIADAHSVFQDTLLAARSALHESSLHKVLVLARYPDLGFDRGIVTKRVAPCGWHTQCRIGDIASKSRNGRSPRARLGVGAGVAIEDHIKEDLSNITSKRISQAVLTIKQCSYKRKCPHPPCQ